MGGFASTLYGQGTYGISIYGQVNVSPSAVPLQAQATVSPIGAPRSSPMAQPLNANASANQIV